MYRLLFDIGVALESDQPPAVLEAKCARALPLYEQYLKTLDLASEIGIDVTQPRLKRSERKVSAVLGAGSRDATSQGLPELVAAKPLGNSVCVFRLLDDSLERVKELVGLALEKINEGFKAGGMETADGSPIEHPDHDTRLLAVGRFCRLLSVLVKRAHLDST